MLALALFISLTAAQTPQRQETINQQSSAPCTVNATQVKGNITINCPGVDPRAMRFFNEQLRKQTALIRQLGDEVQAAEQWRKKYEDLTDRLANAAIDTGLAARVNALVKEGRLEEAQMVLDQLLPEDEKTIDRIARDYFIRARLADLRFDVTLARREYSEAYRLRPDDIAYSFAYGQSLIQVNEFEQARPIFESALRSEQKSGKNSDQVQMGIARTGLGIVYQALRMSDVAAENFEDALYISLSLATKEDRYVYTAGWIFSNLSVCYMQARRFREAESNAEEGLAIYHALSAKDSNTYELFGGVLLYNLGTLYAIRGQLPKAETFLLQSEDKFRLLANANPVHERELAGTLNALTFIYETTGRLPSAYEAMKKLVAILRRLTKEDPEQYRLVLAMGLNNLGQVERLVGDLDEAEQAFMESMQIIGGGPTGQETRLAMSLDGLGLVYHDFGLVHHDARRLSEAEKNHKDALDIYSRLSVANPAIFAPAVARVSYNLASDYYLDRRLEEAEGNYQQALDIYRSLAAENPNVYLTRVRDLLETLADVYLLMQRFEQAIDYKQEALMMTVKLQSGPAAPDIDLTLLPEPMMMVEPSNIAP